MSDNLEDMSPEKRADIERRMQQFENRLNLSHVDPQRKDANGDYLCRDCGKPCLPFYCGPTHWALCPVCHIKEEPNERNNIKFLLESKLSRKQNKGEDCTQLNAILAQISDIPTLCGPVREVCLRCKIDKGLALDLEHGCIGNQPHVFIILDSRPKPPEPKLADQEHSFARLIPIGALLLGLALIGLGLVGALLLKS